MKLIIEQGTGVKETEITVKCAIIDPELEKLIEVIRLHTFSVTGRKDGKSYPLPLSEVYYFESVDGKTFACLLRDVYEVELRLYELEERLANANFVRVGKAVILNVGRLESVRALLNGRMEAQLTNGEKLVITRHYVEGLKEKLGLSGGNEDE